MIIIIFIIIAKIIKKMPIVIFLVQNGLGG